MRKKKRLLCVSSDSQPPLTLCCCPKSATCNDSIQIRKFSFIYPGFCVFSKFILEIEFQRLKSNRTDPPHTYTHKKEIIDDQINLVFVLKLIFLKKVRKYY